MKISRYIIAFLMSLTLFNACDFEDDLNIDPNKPSKPDTRFLFLMAESYAPSYAWNNNYNPWVQLYPQYIAEKKNIQFTKFSITNYSTSNTYSIAMNNLTKIIALNKDDNTNKKKWVSALGDSNNQIAVAMTLKAFFMMHMTDIVGYLPYTDALKGTKDFTPKFDSQQQIYTTLFAELNEAYTKFDAAGYLNSTYDILYNGNVDQWKKLNASIRMMMSIKLQKAAPDLGKTEFTKAYTDGGIVENSDNLIYKYLTENDNENPLYNNMNPSRSGRKDFSPSATIINILKQYNDPRLEKYAAPNKSGEYVGATFGWTSDEAKPYKLEDLSAFNKKYYEAQNTPITLVSASQVLLMATEAASINWIGEDASELYKKGIGKSFEQHGIPESELTSYLASSKVSYSGNDISKVAMQKWIANYMQDGVEAWSDWRRLQIPNLTPGNVGATSVKHIPYRLRYASSDIVSNKENYDKAIKEQGPDDIETKLWWNK